MNKVIASIDDLDDLDLDLEDTNINKVDDEINLEEASIEDTTIDDLELEDVIPEEPVKDDVEVEATKKDPFDEEIEFDLDLELNEQKKPEEPVKDDVEVEVEVTKKDTLDEEIEFDLDLELNEQKKPESIVENKVTEEPKKRGRKSKTETSMVVTTNKPVKTEMCQKVIPSKSKTNECYLDTEFDITKINSKHYRFLVKPLNLHNYEKMIEDCININGEMLNPLQVVMEENEFRLISGFNTFDVLMNMNIKTAKVIVFLKMNTYDIVRRYITATHHLD